jgi:membrane protein DedA with SNARE-associated domain
VLATLLHPGSYLGIFLLMVLTGCGLPVPEEVFIVGAGVLSANGELRPEFAFAACLLGALVGDAAMYGIGYRFGHSLLRRHPRLSKLVGAESEQIFERAVERHGFKVLLMARFMVGVRGPVYLAAGVVRMPFLRFLLWDLICATLVVGIFFMVAFFLGEEIVDLIKKAQIEFTIVALVIATVVVAFFALRRHRRRLLEQVIISAGEAPTPEEAAEQDESPKREAS